MRYPTFILVVILATEFAAAQNVAPDQQRELLSTFKNEFIAITPGKGKFPADFVMGGNAKQQSPKHRVTIANAFSIGKYEVPQNLWQAVMGKNPSRWKGERNSVELLSFDEAADFCRKSTELMRAAKLIEENEVIRLPTEAEWEYAARAGTTTRFSFGDKVEDLDRHGWSTRNAAGNDPPVGALKPNPWGLYDMHGYLWEWCADHGHANYDGAPVDGSAWTEKKPTGKATRILRGGSWKDEAGMLTSSYRMVAPKELRDTGVGLRCVLAKVQTAD